MTARPAQHDCGHTCCDERADPMHAHFLTADNCPSCVSGTVIPLWGLEVALSEHKQVCAACSGNLSADCARVRYSDMLRDKIERLSRG